MMDSILFTKRPVVALCLALGCGLVRSATPGNSPQSVLESQITEGKRLADGVAQNRPVLRSGPLSEYLNRVTQNIVRNSDLRFPLTFRILDSGQAEFLALPGGFLFASWGLIAALDSEAQLAGVMAHAVAHLVAYQFRNARGARRSSDAVAGEEVLETEADSRAVQYVYRCGYDPRGYPEALARLEEASRHGRAHESLASHLPGTRRAGVIERAVQEVARAKPEYVTSTSEFESVRRLTLPLSEVRPAAESQPVEPPAAGPRGETWNTVPGVSFAPAPQGDLCPPIKTGDQWVFSLTSSDPGSGMGQFVHQYPNYAMRALGSRTVGGKQVDVVLNPGNTYQFEARDSTGCYTVATQSPGDFEPVLLRPPRYSIQYPIQIGRSWTEPYQTMLLMDNASLSLTSRIAGVGETVTVPSGTYSNCVRVVSSGSTVVGKGIAIGAVQIQVERHTWYAPGVSAVKVILKETGHRPGNPNTIVTTVGFGSMTMELISFTRK